MPELFQDYWEAVARVQNAARDLDQAAGVIATHATALAKWREIHSSGIDLREWPSADRLNAMLKAYWDASGELSKLYKRFPAEQQRALLSPDQVDPARK